ncbi:Putative E3 ubiquitin-protein ligase [Lodderomyces elongisporus]|uniref:Putative E3 ubiquitin-protein ligase n=1 Tax=Lodderomyces elongisporus TaxID=36914 RepID=UPI00291D37EA|nr:Putative E3 ubiquitin-protein ligase [Lodderomyces elongisporus]WLF79738.1 Putative E3 ubiquitin-protein ligase [Lodderomyces elongisporus]
MTISANQCNGPIQKPKLEPVDSRSGWNLNKIFSFGTSVAKKTSSCNARESTCSKNNQAENSSTQGIETREESVQSNVSTSSTPSTKDIHKCFCCGTILAVPPRAGKFRCSICQTTNILVELITKPELDERIGMEKGSEPISVASVKSLIGECYDRLQKNKTDLGSSKSLHEIFDPLGKYLYDVFSSHDLLNKAFFSKPQYEMLNSSNKTNSVHVDRKGIKEVFFLLTTLPTKRPLYYALKGANCSLRRLERVFTRGLDEDRWVFILFEIPFFQISLTPPSVQKVPEMTDAPEIRMLCYEILKRCLGVLSNIHDSKKTKQIVLNFARMDESAFFSILEVFNLYLSFQLKKYYCVANNPQNSHDGSHSPNSILVPSLEEDEEYYRVVALKAETESASQSLVSLLIPGNSKHLDAGPSRSYSSKKSRKENKIKLLQYGNDWRIHSVLVAISFLFRANRLRSKPIPTYHFYNFLVDYVHIKVDFDTWQRDERRAQRKDAIMRDVLNSIHGSGARNSKSVNFNFYMCQYPFTISLGSKISILEHEARRQMERKAEEAFINSLDKRVVFDTHLRISVRRDHVVQDSLRCLQNNLGSFKKSLRVSFLNEPGIDAGGVRKEWFMLLTKEIFNPLSGMFSNIEDSNLLWFALGPTEREDMYQLFGSILGLALYNSTVLELNFPQALYKVLAGKSLNQSDYKTLHPTIYRSLSSLRKVDANELNTLGLTFEVTYKDVLGTTQTKELIEGGADVLVDESNLEQYIDLYTLFFLRDGVSRQLDAFIDGFKNVIGGNALSLFDEEEIELLLCGHTDHGIDVEILESVTKYTGWPSAQEAKNSTVIKWFWEIMQSMDQNHRKLLMSFVTGSDRVPATGIQNLPFRIHLLNDNQDSCRLPLAHTCFNELAIYNYSSKEKLSQKLYRAMEESSGFGIK